MTMRNQAKRKKPFKAHRQLRSNASDACTQLKPCRAKTLRLAKFTE
ncbi:hypothetical protein [Polaromonas hydrogenivorans]